MFFDLDTRELLRMRPNPLTPTRWSGCVGAARATPATVDRTGPGAAAGLERRHRHGVGQKVSLGRIHAYQTVTVPVSETTLAIELDDGETRVMRRLPPSIRNIKANRPRTVPSVS